MKKRRHHSVWKKYLMAWALNEKIYCLDLSNNNLFNSNPINVGIEKDLYKLNELTEREMAIIKSIIESSPKHRQKAHKKLLNDYNMVFRLKNLLKSKDIKDNEIDTALAEYINNFGEELHSQIENLGEEYIDSIMEEDVSFYDTNDGCTGFLYYLSDQCMRVPLRIKIHGISRIWNLLGHIFADNMGWSLYRDRRLYKIVLLKNNSNVEFITGDKPVINTYWDKETLSLPDEIELYYPVSPKLSVLLTKAENYNGSNNLLLNEKEVIMYNSLNVKNAHRQVYAMSEEDFGGIPK